MFDELFYVYVSLLPAFEMGLVFEDGDSIMLMAEDRSIPVGKSEVNDRYLTYSSDMLNQYYKDEEYWRGISIPSFIVKPRPYDNS